MDKSQHQRSPYWDSIKGFLIFFVVFGHYLIDYLGQNLTTDSIVTVIYLFHMPAFIFVSGLMTSRDAGIRNRSLSLLLGAYVVFNTLMTFVLYITKQVPFSLVTPVYSYWYLVALIIWRVTISKLEKIRGIFFISILLALLVGCFPDVDNVLALSRVFSFYPFFLAGYFLPLTVAKMISSKRPFPSHLAGIALFTVAATLGVAAKVWIGLEISQLLMLPYQEPVDIFKRAFIFLIASVFIAAILLIVPSRPIPFLTHIGENSLPIYVLHRFPTMLAAILFPSIPPTILVPVMLVMSVITVLVLGSRMLLQKIHTVIETVTELLVSRFKKDNIVLKILAISVACVFFLIPVLQLFSGINKNQAISQETFPIVPAIRGAQKSSYDSAVKLLFCGDLLLLEEQVQAGKTSEGYDFSGIFSYTESYIQDADLAVGVFEGPMAGSDAGYSTGNFDDGRPLAFNFPDSFAAAVSSAGFDVVTTANNHLLDQGLDGARRTLGILDEVGLSHVGSYASTEGKMKESILIKEAGGIRFAFVAYTFGINGYTEEDLVNGPASEITTILPPPDSENFDEAERQVRADLERAKAMNPDVIVVLPHMGTQFTHQTDLMQETWNDIFLDAGADAILGDHSHTVQPVEYSDGKAIINCPGNFNNSYNGNDGDFSAMTEIYINPEDASIMGVGIIPTYIRTTANGFSTSIPVYDIFTDPSIYSILSEREIQRVGEVNLIVTESMLGVPLDASSISQRYYLTPDGVMRSEAPALPITPEIEKTVFYQMMTDADSICFVGDSITLGSRCGTNDVRYRDPSTCAMSSEDYVLSVDSLVEAIREQNPDASFILVAPWPSLENDPFSMLDIASKDAMLAQYADALGDYCNESGLIFTDPTPWIKGVWEENRVSNYLLDHIHPNSTRGVELYSYATLIGSGEYDDDTHSIS